MKTTYNATTAILGVFSGLVSAIAAASCENWAFVLVFASLSTLNLGIAAQCAVSAVYRRRIN